MANEASSFACAVVLVAVSLLAVISHQISNCKVEGSSTNRRTEGKILCNKNIFICMYNAQKERCVGIYEIGYDRK